MSAVTLRPGSRKSTRWSAMITERTDRVVSTVQRVRARTSRTAAGPRRRGLCPVSTSRSSVPGRGLASSRPCSGGRARPPTTTTGRPPPTARPGSGPWSRPSTPPSASLSSSPPPVSCSRSGRTGCTGHRARPGGGRNHPRRQQGQTAPHRPGDHHQSGQHAHRRVHHLGQRLRPRTRARQRGSQTTQTARSPSAASAGPSPGTSPACPEARSRWPSSTVTCARSPARATAGAPGTACATS